MSAGLRDVLGDFRSRALLILDEAHHAAPAGGARYAIASQFTQGSRAIWPTASSTACSSPPRPHNGHSNSFSALLEMLDPQRFTRGVEVAPRDLEPVMVRRLKADLRRLGEAFPERIDRADPSSTGCRTDAPELDLWRRPCRLRRLRDAPHRDACRRTRRRSPSSPSSGCSSGCCPRSRPSRARLKVHRTTLERLVDGEQTARAHAGRRAGLRRRPHDRDGATSSASRTRTPRRRSTPTRRPRPRPPRVAAPPRPRPPTCAGRARRGRRHARHRRAGARKGRTPACAGWSTGSRPTCSTGERWNERRLIIFTEYEDTRRWLERRLGGARRHRPGRRAHRRLHRRHRARIAARR